jgi:hypothetical protein
MDTTIKIEGERLITTIYAKPIALYQYILPNSCHPPGALTGLIFGQILQIYQLCSLSKDINKELSLFYQRLLNCRHKPEKLLRHSLRKASTTRLPTFPSLQSSGKLKIKPRSDGWTNTSSSTSHITLKTHHQASSDIYGKTWSSRQQA